LARRKEKEGNRVFSVELEAGNDLKKVSIPYGAQRLLMDGTIGTLKRVDIVEDSVLGLTGSSGVLESTCQVKTWQNSQGRTAEGGRNLEN
jgi:hypothetical protein